MSSIKVMESNIKKQINVIAFSKEQFDYNELNKLSDEELYRLMKTGREEGKDILIWCNLLTFQYALNANVIEKENRWFYFIEV